MASLLCFFSLSLLLLGLGQSLVAGAAQVPAVFVFGDSLVDPGNNNQLITLARADYRPHGIDFPEGTTGRFCNGGTVVDHLDDPYELLMTVTTPSQLSRNDESKLKARSHYRT